MAPSPWAEEEEDTSTGSGGWRGRSRYAVGNEVEVRLDERGFRGAHFEATIAARLPRSGGYEVVYSTLLVRRGGPPLREHAARTHVRPRPPPSGSPGCEIKLFDLVEAYHSDGWWPGVVSCVWTGQGKEKEKETRYTVSLPLFREVLELPASLVRPRREFVCGSWMDAQEVVRGIPLYAEGSSVEVICDEEKKGRAWMPGTIIKMVGGTNYVVRYGNGEGSIEVLHSRFIRPQPIFDKMKLEYEFEPSAEVEVYQDGIWSLGVIADVSSCEPRRYGVRVKRHDRTDEDDYLLVSSVSLRPYSKWNDKEWRPCSTKKNARKVNYAVSDEESYSPVFSTPGGDSDQYSSVPNKRVGKENVEKKEPRLKLGRHCLPKALASKRKELLSVSSIDDIIEIGSKSSYVDVVVISDDSGYGNFIEISDNSSSSPNRKKRRMNLPDEELHSNHVIHCYQASRSASNLSQAHNPHHDVLLEVTRHSEEQACSHVLSQSVLPLESSQDPSHKDGGQLILLPGCPIHGLLRMNETKEPQLSNHLHLESALMALDDSAAGDENHEMCQKVNSWVAGSRKEGADTSLINSENSNQKTVDRSCGEAFSIGKLEPSSSAQQDIKADLLCMQAPTDNKMEIRNKRTGMSPEEEASFPIRKLEPSSSAQQNVKVDLLCMEPSNDNKMEIKNERTGMSLEAAAGFHLEISAKTIADVSHPEFNASSQHPLGQLQVPVSRKSAGQSSFLQPGVMVDLSAFMPLPAPNSSTLPTVFSTSSLLLMPDYKMKVFERLPQKPHFREAWDCCPEFREGKALGLMLSFTNMAGSIKNMRIQDAPQLYQEKMSSLLDLEENGFEVGALKVRLHNLLCIRNRQIDLKNRKASLDNEILKTETINCGLEQQLKLLDMYITGLGEDLMQYRETKASLVMQKTAICSYISKLQADLHQVEESLMSAEADFNSIAAAPWCSDVGSSLL